MYFEHIINNFNLYFVYRSAYKECIPKFKTFWDEYTQFN